MRSSIQTAFPMVPSFKIVKKNHLLHTQVPFNNNAWRSYNFYRNFKFGPILNVVSRRGKDVRLYVITFYKLQLSIIIVNLHLILLQQAIMMRFAVVFCAALAVASATDAWTLTQLFKAVSNPTTGLYVQPVLARVIFQMGIDVIKNSTFSVSFV